jgi:DNA topoisomerase-3
MITGQDFLNRIRTLAKEMTDDIFNTYSTKEE